MPIGLMNLQQKLSRRYGLRVVWAYHCSLVIVHDFDIRCAAIDPNEAYPHADIDPDAVLPRAIASQHFQMIARRMRRSSSLMQSPIAATCGARHLQNWQSGVPLCLSPAPPYSLHLKETIIV
jgi:hypothetical protein